MNGTLTKYVAKMIVWHMREPFPLRFVDFHEDMNLICMAGFSFVLLSGFFCYESNFLELCCRTNFISVLCIFFIHI